MIAVRKRVEVLYCTGECRHRRAGGRILDDADFRRKHTGAERVIVTHSLARIEERRLAAECRRPRLTMRRCRGQRRQVLDRHEVIRDPRRPHAWHVIFKTDLSWSQPKRSCDKLLRLRLSGY